MNAPRTKIPGVVVFGLILAIALDTLVHVVWKLAVDGIPADASVAATVEGTLRSPFFYVAMLAFGVQFYNWMRVLGSTDLSFAQPITALSYVSVLAVSGAFLHEDITFNKLAGAALILVGVAFISRTPHSTQNGGGAAEAGGAAEGGERS